MQRWRFLVCFFPQYFQGCIDIFPYSGGPTRAVACLMEALPIPLLLHPIPSVLRIPTTGTTIKAAVLHVIPRLTTTTLPNARLTGSGTKRSTNASHVQLPHLPPNISRLPSPATTSTMATKKTTRATIGAQVLRELFVVQMDSRHAPLAV